MQIEMRTKEKHLLRMIKKYNFNKILQMYVIEKRNYKSKRRMVMIITERPNIFASTKLRQKYYSKNLNFEKKKQFLTLD